VKAVNQFTETIHNLEAVNKEDLKTITQALVRITSLTPEEIKPHLDEMLKRLMNPKERLTQETATPEEWSRTLKLPLDAEQWEADMKALTEGAERIPVVSPEAFTRESMYGNHD